MTNKVLAWFRCPICDKSFLSYLTGHMIYDCFSYHEDLCFFDNTIGEIHENSYLHTIKGIRKCSKCRISHQLEEFII